LKTVAAEIRGRLLCYIPRGTMNFSRDYVGYLGRRTIKHLIDAKMIETEKVEVLNARVQAALIDELMLEDRINDEVRLILEAYQEEMRRTGASYQEMFKKIKQELARKYKAVL
jgi:hypothetical protein